MPETKTNLLAPLSNIDETISLMENGADELFCGFIPHDKVNESRALMYLNRRATLEANITSLKELREIVRMANHGGRPLFITFNEHFYSTFLYDVIFDTLDKLNLGAPNGVIVTDPGLILMLKKRFPQLAIVGSTGCPVFNTSALAFYKEIGVDRVTLSIAHTIEEIRGLAEGAKQIGIDIECFIKNEACVNTNALCNFIHGWIDDGVTKSFCGVQKEYSVQHHRKNAAAEARNRLDAIGSQSSSGCGACLIPAFIKSGVGTMKLDGRTRSSTEKIKDIVFIKNLLNPECHELAPDEFRTHAKKLFTETYGYDCKEKCVYT